ncbi:NUDIX hydrolase [Corynebacterium sp. 13CS0277]|uniref:NUDIX hydrolase n=1 Tax=Corynebacterium sp. 13CS0277 TaxID=2071994 RepID=UPI000D0257C5|nr:NUDIX domain-containing protein [Corynebacterium sp. 13CS0277]PRQ10730.1 NUDIX hydrolase [Corynebacterium sp. 13CS0277]
MEGPDGRKLAATVLLIRDGASGLEVYVQERTHTMPTFPQATVFPGGGVDARDYATPTPHLWAWHDADHFKTLMGVDRDTARALVFAAVREVFEETGLLLVVDQAGEVLKDARRFHAERLAMEAHMLPLFHFLDDHGLRVDSRLLVPFARWVGPPGLELSRQYDTFSFLVHSPAGQEPDDRHTRETTSAGWFSPQVLLDGFAAGLLDLVLPTWSQVRRLAQFSSVEDAFAHPPAYPLIPRNEVIRAEPWYEEYAEIRAARGPRRF